MIGAMPDLPIVDSHVHLWDPSLHEIPWLHGNDRLNHVFGLPEEAIRIVVPPMGGAFGAKAFVFRLFLRCLFVGGRQAATGLGTTRPLEET